MTATDVLTYVGGQPPKFGTVEEAEAWMQQAFVPTRYRVITFVSDDPFDEGDWLPQTREHYERVGPFRVDGKDVDWDTWWNQPDGYARVENWTSYYMVLERWCSECQSWSDTGEALHGLDYFDGDQAAPDHEQVVDLTEPWPARLDTHLQEVASDLVHQDHYNRTQSRRTP